MSVMGIEGIGAAMGASGIGSIGDLPGVGGTKAVEGADGGFGTAIASALESVQAAHSKSDGLAVQAATGELKDVHDYTIASAEAKLATEITVAVRNKAVEAFSEIMRLTV
jgi:flagellar hook-basal body complex protein FliE